MANDHYATGTPEDAPASDPAGNATMIALLKGLLAALGTADDDPGHPTVIGQLKQIASNTGGGGG